MKKFTNAEIADVIISNSVYDNKEIFVDGIDMIRFAEPDETFDNKWDF